MSLRARLSTGVLDSSMKQLFKHCSTALAGLNIVFGYLPPEFTVQKAAAFKADLQSLTDFQGEMLLLINKYAGSKMWDSMPACKEVVQGVDTVLEHAAMLVQRFNTATLQLCDMRMKMRDKVAFSVEFAALSKSLEELDWKNPDWGSSTSIALEHVNGMYEGLTESLDSSTAAMRRCLVKASDAEWAGCVKGLLPESEAFSVSWKVLAAMIGQGENTVAALPLKLEALPNSSQGKAAVKELARHCAKVQQLLDVGLHVAILKGDRERAFLVSWQRLAAFRELSCRFVDVLLTKGFNPDGPDGNPLDWLNSTRGPFLAVMKAAEVYNDAHSTGVCATAKVALQDRLLEGSSQSPAWADMKSLHEQAMDIKKEMANHMFSAM